MDQRSRYFSQTAVYLLLFVFSTVSCSDLSVEKSLADEDFQLVDQDSSEVIFPGTFSGHVTLVGFVYTRCPDICPLITYNMRDVQQELSGEDEFMLVSISFDPERDTPAILADYASNFKLDQSNWRMLTGNPQVVKQALDELSIRTLKTPTTFTEDGEAQYFIDHTDEVALIDRHGNVRNTYPGSEMDTDEIVQDIHTLLTDN
ncbi:MAG: hypothetical protein GVY08_02875 [Bacteroidetes bacterium]|jgi:protein SCO1/2|nr:hypothetical protein [Bacteroidota bacterium]